MNNILELKCFSKATWNFVSSIYKAGWDTIDINKDNNSFKNGIANKFTPKVPKIKPSSNSNTSKDKAVKIIRLPPSIPAHLSKEVLEKSKFFSKEKKNQ